MTDVSHLTTLATRLRDLKNRWYDWTSVPIELDEIADELDALAAERGKLFDDCVLLATENRRLEAVFQQWIAQADRMLAAPPVAPAGAREALAHTHEFTEFVICRHCGRTEAAIQGCHHCNENEPGRLCWWCLTPAALPVPALAHSDVINDVVSHWFVQGGKAQFGELNSPQNADELVSAILSRVRSTLAHSKAEGSSDPRSPQAPSGEHPICPWCDKPVVPGTSPFIKSHWPCPAAPAPVETPQFEKNGIRTGERVIVIDVPSKVGTVIRCTESDVDVRWDDGQLGELVWNHEVAYNAYRLQTVRSEKRPAARSAPPEAQTEEKEKN